MPKTKVTPTKDGGVVVQLHTDTSGAVDVNNLAVEIEQTTAAKYPSIMDENKLLTGPELLTEMGGIVVEDYNTDKASRSVWEENTAKGIKLFNAFLPAKSWPWENASNVCMPFLSIATLQFQARAFDAIIPSKEVVKVFDPGGDDKERADRVSKHMDYQILYEIPEFEADMDRMLLQLPLVGSVFKKTYRDHVNKVNRSEFVPSSDFVYNYHAKSLIDADRGTHVLSMSRNDIRIRAKNGIFLKSAWKLGHGSTGQASEIKDAVDEAEGKSPPNPTSGKPRIVLEQHRNWDIDGDGIEEPYIITVDFETNTILRIANGKENGEKIEYFTEYTFFPNPEGGYGIGFGTLIRGLNEAANGIINEVIDAGELANLQGGFYLTRSGIKGKDLKFKQGQYKAINALTDDIRKALVTHEFRGPNATLYQVLGLLFEFSKLVSSISETMTGQLPSSDTPATTVLALIEEGRKVFSSIHRRIHGAFKHELAKIYRLNRFYLDEKRYFKAIGKSGVPEGETITTGRADYAADFNIIPVSDPNITSRAEKIVKAEQVVNDIRNNPLTAGNKEANYKATKRYYETLEVHDVEDLLQDPAPQDISPEEENAGFLTEDPANLLPDQDHAHHSDVHMEFIEGPFTEELSPVGKDLAQKHIQEHIAQIYLQTAQQRPEQGGFQGELGFEGPPGPPRPIGEELF